MMRRRTWEDGAAALEHSPRVTNLVVRLVYTHEEEKLGQEETHTKVQVHVGVLVLNSTAQQEGGYGQGEAHQGDDCTHVADDIQGEFHLAGRKIIVGLTVELKFIFNPRKKEESTVFRPELGGESQGFCPLESK